MNTLIRFSREDERSSLETSKYLSNLVKALALAKVKVTTNLLDKVKIAHFISPSEEKQINDAYLEDLFVVISLGYCEEDIKHRFFKYEDNALPTLTPLSRKLVKQADLVLVPNEIIKNYLLKDDIEVGIEIVSPGVDLDYFSSLGTITSSTFDKYFLRKPSRPYVLTHGNLNEIELNSIKTISRGLPTIDFYYIVDDETLSKSISEANKVRKNLPTNLTISYEIPEDVYKVGLSKTLCYLSLPNFTGDYLTIFEAFACKVPVIYMDLNKKHGIFKNRENVMIAANEEKAEKLIWSLSKGAEKTTINMAYELAKENSLQVMGTQIKQIYENLIK